MKPKYPSPEWYAMIGSKGGKKKNPLKGFGTNKKLARIVGAKGGKIGGRISRRKK